MGLLASMVAPAANAATAVTVTGSAVEGSALAVKAPKRGTKFTWLRCTAAGARCATIRRAVGPRYVLTVADVGSTVRAASGAGKKQVRSKASARVRPKVPTAKVLPSISGAAGVDATLTASPGTWAPTGRTYTFTYRWLRCPSATTCTPITGATHPSYVTTAADAGGTVQVEVTATAKLRGVSNLGRARSDRSLRGGPGAPGVIVANVTAPSIAGGATEGRTLRAARGTWAAGSSAVETSVAWQRCLAGSCAAVPGATSDDYTATAEDIGRQLRVVVTATAAGSTATATSATTSSVAAAVPTQRTSPTLSPASPAIGDAVTASNGTWDSPAPTTYTFQWQRCTPPGSLACVDILGATSNPYVTGAADATFSVRVRVTAHHGSAGVSATSVPTSTINGVGPTLTLAPSISGQAIVGQLLTGASGSFSGPGLVTTAGRWQRCDAVGAGCVDIAGQTGATYTLGTGDLGATITYAVTATNAWGSASSSSAATTVVAGTDPVNTVLPSVGGALYQTGIATATPGTWTGLAPMTFAYQWQRCAAGGGSCSDIAGATTSSYVVTAPDVANTLRVLVTATNSTHTATDLVATAPVSGLVGASPNPVAVAAPTVTGSAADGATLTWHAGTYTGQAPIALARQWQRCTAAGTACVDIAGATATTLVLAHGDVGSTFRVRETASNSFGTAPVAASVVTGTVAAVAPSNTAGPTVGGVTTDGATLTADPGTWSGTPPFTYAYQWRRCDSSGATCANVGTSSASYVLTPADVASTIRVVVTASNVAGPGTPATSATSAPVAAAPPVAGTPLPQVSGTAAKNQTLTSTTGTFTGTAPFTYTYAWQRCTAAGTGCAPITGATSATYLLVQADVGATLRSRVTAHSATLPATATADSAASPVVANVLAPPTETTPVAITGLAEEHATLTATPAVFAGTAPIAHAYQWRRCDNLGATCVNVTDPTDPSGATYTLGAADVDSTMRVIDTGTNAAGSAPSTSAQTAVVIETFPAVNTVAPAITGQLEDGAILTAADGTWTGTPNITFDYSWYRCHTDGTSCVALAGETQQSYRLVTADVGSSVQVRVHGANDFGGATVGSPVSSEVAPARRPVNSGSLPSVITEETSGVPETTQDITADDGTWSGTEAIHTYQWKSCDAFGEACVAIPGATATTYTVPHPSAVGKTYRVVVTYTNPAGTDTAESPATFATILGTVPAPGGAPTVLQDQNATIDLDGTQPDWTGTKPMQFQYEWMLCQDEFDAAQCASYLPRSDSASYTTTAADFQPTQSWLRLRVWATNALSTGGVASPLSNAIHLVQTCSGTCPGSCLCSMITGPSITGEAIFPGTLTGDDGTWTGAVALTFLHQWLRCDAAGDNCTAIAGATDQTYDTQALDVGSTIRFQVTAHTPYGDSAPEVSPQTDVVVNATPPVNTALPSISRTSGAGDTVGAQFTVDPGTWTGSPTPVDFAYQWQRCDAAGANCVDILDATSASYTPVQGDLGATLIASVTATNVAGSAAALTTQYPNPGVILQADAPVAPTPGEILVTNDTDTDVGAALVEGQSVSVDAGTWGGTPTVSFTYQWQQCDATGGLCSDLPGETGQIHTVAGTEVGSTLRVVVVGHNPSPTTATQTSDRFPAASTIQAAVLPASIAAVSIDAAPERTKLDTGDIGLWSGSKEITYAPQWQRCSSTLAASCADITGETGTSYTPTAVDVNAAGSPYRLRLVVTATNVAGSATAASPISNPVLPGTAPTLGATPPSVSGAPAVGNSLTADVGTWTGTDPTSFTFTYQWRQCNSTGLGCHDILGETSDTYDVRPADANLRVRVVVVAHNAVGVSSPVTTAPSGVITP
ncbi:MAG: hypothetical protein JWM98_1574 [Thermoleophilia bacterium]|nr:hypothetical protein [Thermoleophilia bacterium]